MVAGAVPWRAGAMCVSRQRPDFLRLVTGWNVDTDECYRIGEPIANL